MNIRVSSAASASFHLILLMLLSMLSFRSEPPAPPLPGMAIEVVDTEYAMAAPAAAPDARDDGGEPAENSSPSSDPGLEPSTEKGELVSAERTSEADMSPTPEAVDRPVQQESSPLLAARRDTELPTQLAPGPVVPLSPPAMATPSIPRVDQPQSTSAGATAERNVETRARLNSAALARTLAGRTAAPRRQGFNAAAIGSSLGRAVPKGAAGLSLRQRADLIGMIRRQIIPCWNPPLVEERNGQVSVRMRVRFDPDGKVRGQPDIVSIAGRTAVNTAYVAALTGSVRRAVLRCSPLSLPSELYAAWADVELNFDPRDVS